MTSYACVGDGFSITDPEVDHMYEAYDNENSKFFVIADTDNKIYGCGGIGPLIGGPSTTCELKKMYFYESARGQGLGKQMMELCLATARQLGYTYCYLETVTRMERANHLYAKYGFTKLKTQIGGTGHSGCDTYYQKKL
jgi:putative acetyltransferase